MAAQGICRDSYGWEFERDGIVYRIINTEEGHKEVMVLDVTKKFREKRTECVIPRTVTEDKIEYCVTKIGGVQNGLYNIPVQSFGACEKLEKITIPNTVRYIGYGAFAYCEQLTTVSMTHTVTYLGESAFQGCSKLQYITLSTGLTTIEANTFVGCSSLKSITIPETIKTIGKQAFYGCTSLESITIPDGVETIGFCAFSNTAISTATIGKKVRSIDPTAFCDCPNLIGITVSKQNDYYSSDDEILYNKDQSTLIRYPQKRPTANYSVLSTTKTIGKYAFYKCPLTDIYLPESLRSIEDHAFEKSENLTNLDIPYTVQSIGISAFCDCSKIKRIAIPAATTKIDFDAFKGCSAATIYCTVNSKPSDWSDSWNYDNLTVKWGCKEIVVTVIPPTTKNLSLTTIHS